MSGNTRWSYTPGGSQTPEQAAKAGIGITFKFYRKKVLQLMRPYVPGEDLTGISVNKEDTPELGGMIAINIENHEDKWYVAKKFFAESYEKAQP